MVWCSFLKPLYNTYPLYLVIGCKFANRKMFAYRYANFEIGSIYIIYIEPISKATFTPVLCIILGLVYYFGFLKAIHNSNKHKTLQTMAQVHGNARARVFNYVESDDAMTPLPPPPRPQARPLVRGVPMATAARAAAHNRHQRASHQSNLVDDDVGAPQPAPVPHAHPLAALSGNITHLRHSDQSTRHMSSRLRGKRLNPAFFNRERITAFLGKENTEDIDGEARGQGDREANSANDYMHERPLQLQPPVSFMDSQRLHSTRIIQSRMRDIANEPTQVPDLLEEEKIIAATNASHWRHELHPLSVTTIASANGAGIQQDSALERARHRKVKKQVDPKWLQTQSDASNRPRGVFERDEELHLREVLVQTTVSELLFSGVLFDDDDDAKHLASFPPLEKPTLPIYSSGMTGLSGCCYDSWSY